MLKSRAGLDDQLTLQELERRTDKQEAAELVARAPFLGTLLSKFKFKIAEKKSAKLIDDPDGRPPWEHITNAEQQEYRDWASHYLNFLQGEERNVGRQLVQKLCDGGRGV